MFQVKLFDEIGAETEVEIKRFPLENLIFNDLFFSVIFVSRKRK